MGAGPPVNGLQPSRVGFAMIAQEVVKLCKLRGCVSQKEFVPNKTVLAIGIRRQISMIYSCVVSRVNVIECVISSTRNGYGSKRNHRVT